MQRRAQLCIATGHSVKEAPVQKSVPVIGTPADADPEQHEVLEQTHVFNDHVLRDHSRRSSCTGVMNGCRLLDA